MPDGHKKILIVERDKRFRDSIKRGLKGEAYTFFEASSVQEGIDLVKKETQVRVILLGLSFGENKDADFVERIRDNSSKYRVIILTGHEELLDAETVRDHRVFSYLPKTTHFSQSLLFTVEQAFDDIERELLRTKFASLLDIQSRINSNRELSEVLDLVCRSVRRVVGAYTCHIRVFDPKTGDFLLAAFSGPSEKMRVIFDEPKQLPQSFSRMVAGQSQPICFEDLPNEREFKEFRDKVLSSDGLTQEARRYFDTVRSAYVVPISTKVFGTEIDAVLNVSSESNSFFTEDKRCLVDEFATQATLAITKNWLQGRGIKARHDYKQISEMLSEVSDQLRGENIRDRVYGIVTHRIAEIVSSETVSIFLMDESTGRLENVAELRGNSRIERSEESYAPGQSLTGWVYATGETIRLPNPERRVYTKPPDDTRYDDSYGGELAMNIPSGKVEHYIGVPIKVGNHVIGVLRAINRKSEYYEKGDVTNSDLSLVKRGFSKDSQTVLEIAANHLAVAVQNEELISELNWQVEQLRTLNEVGRLISSEINIDDLLELTIRETADVMRAEICMLFLKNEAGDKLTLRQCYGMPTIENVFYEIGEGMIGNVALTGRPILVAELGSNDGKYDREILEFLRKEHGRGMESLMAVPIRAKGNILGVIKVINVGTPYQEGDLSLFEIFANFVGVAIENAQIYDLTNQKLAIAESNAALSLLVRAVAHEINNSSALIPVNVRAIKAALRDSGASLSELLPRIDEMLDVIEDSATQAVGFANEIAGFSRMENGKVTEINDVITRAIAQLQPELEANKNFMTISLDVRLSDKPIYCYLYETPFIQIVRNIVINAYQAMEANRGGLLTIRSSKDPLSHLARIEFADTGCGIRKKDIKRIFDADFTTKANGNGMGLWLVRNHLERIGAVMHVNSEFHEGTTFILEIPLGVPSM